MPDSRELRHADFGGLALARDPVTGGAVIARNVQVRRPGLLEKRPGIRRLNHRHYNGAIVCLSDCQRFCDYGKFLVISDGAGGAEAFEHGDGTGGSLNDPVQNKNWPPVAKAAVTPIPATLTVTCSPAGSFDPDGDPITYLWDFGDGTTSTFPTPTHTYASGGAKTITLTVTDSHGAIGTDSVTVTLVGFAVWGGTGAGYWDVGP